MVLEFPDTQSKVDNIINLVESDIITIDEARQVLGFPPLPNDIGSTTLSVYLSSLEADIFSVEAGDDGDDLSNIHLN